MAGRLLAQLRPPRILWSLIALGAALAVFLQGGSTSTAEAASSRYLMCNWTVEYRTQTVYIDPSVAVTGVSKAQVHAAFASWNALFVKYHGFPIFAETTSKSHADVVIDARSSASTWVNGVCNPGYVSAGSSHTTVYLGVQDYWRNAAMIAHELGHALGLADHGADAQHSAGHIGYQSCSNYLGVMSYCSSPQIWFMDTRIEGLYLDGQLVRDYWR